MAKIKAPLIYTIGVNKPQSIRLAAYGTVLFFLAAALFSSLIPNSNQPFNPLIGIIVYFLTMAAHEAVHGFFFGVYGGRPKYGVGLMYHFFPYAYATSPGQPYNYNQMVFIGMSPFVVICVLAFGSAAALPSLASYAAIAFIGNFSGAVGDMWLLRQIMRFKGVSDLQFVDLKSGIAVYGSGDKGKKAAAHMAELDNDTSKVNSVVSKWLTSAAIMVLVSALLPILLAIVNFNGHILVGPSQFPLFEYINSAKQNSFTLNPLPIVFGALIFALIYEQLEKIRVRKRSTL